MRPYLEPTVEIFDRTYVPLEIAELLAEWPEMDPGTAKLIRAAISSQDPQRMRFVWYLLAARAVPLLGLQSEVSPALPQERSARRRCGKASG